MALKLLLVVNDSAYFLSHRLPIALVAKETGYDVHVATPMGSAVEKIVAYGLTYHALHMNRSGKNPLIELCTVFALVRLFRRVRPDIVHLVTIKPVIYGGIAARLAGIPAIVAAIPGLGTVFSQKGVMASVLRYFVAKLYRIALGAPNLCAIFQNRDDAQCISRVTELSSQQMVLIRGAGVDLQAYASRSLPDGIPVVVMASRLLIAKGGGEFAEAAHLLQQRGVKARCVLVGAPDPGNPASLTQEDIERWVAAGWIEHWGHRTDMPEVLAAASLVTLPSYYPEGVPKVLIEAQACGRAVITTDMPGCRDAITPDVTGLLVPPRDAVALADAIEKLLNDRHLLQTMGEAGRALAEKCFDVRQVVAEHLDIYRGLLKKAGMG
jgi:glycosyltransferase involved in cell wall biosynthesis